VLQLIRPAAVMRRHWTRGILSILDTVSAKFGIRPGKPTSRGSCKLEQRTYRCRSFTVHNRAALDPCCIVLAAA
jgi:hypothetical protein